MCCFSIIVPLPPLRARDIYWNNTPSPHGKLSAVKRDIMRETCAAAYPNVRERMDALEIPHTAKRFVHELAKFFDVSDTLINGYWVGVTDRIRGSDIRCSRQ